MSKEGKINGYLPSLRRTDKMPSVAKVGRWDSGGGEEFLGALINSMPAGIDLTLSDLVSLPHIWGQTVAFSVAWKDKNHPFHNIVVQEWRGILALMALSAWENWPVRALKVDLVDLAERPFETNAAAIIDGQPGQSYGNFPKIVKESLPDRTAIHRKDWVNSAVILYDRKAARRGETSIDARPIAYCVPTSLVAPARNYAGVIDERIPWRSVSNNGYPLRDPLQCNGKPLLSPVQYAVLLQYLTEVRSQVIRLAKDADRNRVSSPSEDNSADDVRDTGDLDSRLKEFIEDVKKWGPDKTFRLSPPRESLDGWDGEQLAELKTTPYKALSVVPRRPPSSLASDTLIPHRSDVTTPFKGVLLYGSSLREQSGKSAVDIVDILVWGRRTLKDFGDAPSHFPLSGNEDGHDEPHAGALANMRRDVEREAREAGYLLLHVDELFYSNITAVSEAPVDHESEWGHWLPPLRPLALALFSPDYLRQNLTIEDQGDEIRVTIRLTGIPGRGKGLGDQLVKRFRKRTGQISQKPSVLALWPSFNSLEWSHYYIFHVADTSREIDLAPLPMAEDWLPLFHDDWRDRGDIRAFFENLGRHENLVDRAELTTAGRMLRTHRLDRPPEGMVAIVDNEHAGLILLPPQPVRQLSDKPAIVGLDIGSTNTSAAWLLPGVNDLTGRQLQVEFNLRSLLRFVYAGTSQDANEIEAAFGLPNPSHAAPYLSLLRERRPSPTREEPQPFLNYMVPWPILTKRRFDLLRPDNGVGSDPETFICDLKWIQRNQNTLAPDNFETIERYLRVVMLMVGAGVVGRGFSLRTTEWRFSYPDTFTTAEIDSYSSVIDQLNHQIHYPRKTKDHFSTHQVRRTYAIREYECVGKYFLSRYGEVARSNTVIVFDVGGHNTEVALWHANKPKWNATLALASQDTLVDFMMKNSDLFNQMFPNQWGNYDNILKSKTCGDAFKKTATEAFIQDDAFSAWQNRVSGLQRDSGRISQLKDMATFTIAGLLYYVAIAYVETILVRSQGENPDAPLEVQPIQFCFGGKGSLLFKHFIDVHQHARLIEWFYKRVDSLAAEKGIQGVCLPEEQPGSKRWVCPPFIFSEHPKQEVSEGLLTWLPIDLQKRTSDVPNGCCTINPSRPPLYVGDKIRLVGNNNDNEYNFFFSEEDISKDGWKIGDLSEVLAFLRECEETFKVVPQTYDDFDPNDIDRLHQLSRARVQKALDDECRLARNDQKRSRRSGDSLTYQPQPVFILALRDIIRQWNKYNQRAME
jgi:hypothetical protein